jgi:hypothetical protein
MLGTQGNEGPQELGKATVEGGLSHHMTHAELKLVAMDISALSEL